MADLADVAKLWLWISQDNRCQLKLSPPMFVKNLLPPTPARARPRIIWTSLNLSERHYKRVPDLLQYCRQAGRATRDVVSSGLRSIQGCRALAVNLTDLPMPVTVLIKVWIVWIKFNLIIKLSLFSCLFQLAKALQPVFLHSKTMLASARSNWYWLFIELDLLSGALQWLRPLLLQRDIRTCEGSGISLAMYKCSTGSVTPVEKFPLLRSPQWLLLLPPRPSWLNSLSWNSCMQPAL